MSYINRSSVHWKIGGRWSYGTSLCGSTDNAYGCRGWEHCWGGSTSIHLGARGSTIIHWGVGDAKAQQRAMEMERCDIKVVAKRRFAILDITTILEKGIKIPEPEWFMWT